MTEPFPELDGTTTGSPDAPAPVSPDLLESITEEDLVQAAIEHAQVAIPEWEPRAGHTEVILMESLAQMLTILSFAVQQAPTELLEQLMRLYGTDRDQGASTRAVARFEASGSQPLYVVPEGTQVRTTMASTGEVVDFTTTGRLEIQPQESTSGLQEIVAVEAGAGFNGIPAGSTLEMVDNLPFLEHVQLDTPTAGGRDVESDAAFQARASAMLGRLVSTLVLPDHFQQAAVELPEVGRARVIDVYDPTDPEAGESPGHVTVAVADNDGQPLTPGQMGEVKHHLEQQAMASLIIHIIEPTYTSLDITLEVRAAPGANLEDVEDAVEERVQSWLSPARWGWGDMVRQFALVSEVSQVEGVAQVLSAPADMSLDGVAPLPSVDQLTVTVQEG
ncbi:baseplate J/gp47 family protein [Nesterenkonia sp. HG001]|uniref:baseplate J/gp47 family protein n=2 Tax=Bacteria TaxID=2 RepID=UPI002AC6517F|nr:baseplate J/gp47 family protein [Nesterenkonia sp. HG001]MDZ5076796.1 baseplate J/gp47 family protein [Nesterenkonia sp. HG001]